MRGWGVWLIVGAILGAVVVAWAAQSETINLQWDPVPEAAGYFLYYGTSMGQYSTVVDPGEAVTASVGGLRRNRRYYFAVTAYDDMGNESGFSNEVSGIAGR